MANFLDESASSRSKVRPVVTVFAVVLLAHLAIALAVGVESWDDGYIILAFARTFAETGHIGLTPLSDQVEGATSPLWFLLMSALYSVGARSFYSFHFASQLAAGLCFAFTAVLFYRLIVRSVPKAASWITVLVFLLGPIRAETGNGMEMALLCLVVLAILTLLRDDDGRRWVALASLAALIPWIRLEATGYVAAGVFAVWAFSSPRNRRSLVLMIGASIVSAAALTVVRYLVFGTTVLTNTMLAKQMPPYSPPFPSPAWWGQQVIGFVAEPVVTVLPAVVVFLILLRLSGQRLRDQIPRLGNLARSRRVPVLISFGLAYTAAFIGFTAVFGANIFTLPGRMGMSATVVLVVAAVTAVPITERKYRPLGAGSKLAIAGMFLVPCVGLLNYDTLGMGMRVAQHVADGPFTRVFSFSAFHANGKAAEKIRSLLDLPRISVLLTDVGQPGLCCQRLQILDLGLLTNRELTKTGWAGFPEYLRRRSPDLIQLHSSFTQESGITKDAYFKENYSPVFVGDSLFYLRGDHYSRLEGRCVFGSAPDYYFFYGGEPLTSQLNSPFDSSLRVDREYLDSLQLTEYCHLS